MRVVALIIISGFFTLLATPWMLARLPGLTIGALLFVLGPIVEHRPQWLAMEWNLDAVDLFLAGVPNDAQIAMSILRRRAAEGKPLLGDRDMQIALAGGSDIEDDAPLIDAAMDEQSEAGSTIGSTVDGSVVGSSAVGSSSSVATSAATTAELKNRKVDWAKWKNRATYGRDLLVTGSEVLAGQRALQLPRFDTGASSAPGAGKMAAIGSGLARGANWGLEQVSQQTSRALVERQLVALGDTLPTDSVHWSIYNGVCGHLIVRASPTPRLLFVSLFAQKAGAAADAPVVDETGQGVPAEIATAKIRVLLDVHLESLLVLKKTATVNLRFSKVTLDGLDIGVRAKVSSSRLGERRSRLTSLDRPTPSPAWRTAISPSTTSSPSHRCTGTAHEPLGLLFLSCTVVPHETLGPAESRTQSHAAQQMRQMLEARMLDYRVEKQVNRWTYA
jgi:hypothetical protein